MLKSRSHRLVGLAAALSAGFACTAMGQNVRVNWTGDGDGVKWSDPRNWRTLIGNNIVPGLDDIVDIAPAAQTTIKYDLAASPPDLWSLSITNATLEVQTVENFRVFTVRDIVIGNNAGIRGRPGAAAARNGGNVILETLLSANNGKVVISGKVWGGAADTTGKGGDVKIISPAAINNAVNISGYIYGGHSPAGDGGTVDVMASRGGITLNVAVGGDAGPNKAGGQVKVSAARDVTTTTGLWGGHGANNPNGRGGSGGGISVSGVNINANNAAWYWAGSGGNGTGGRGGDGGAVTLTATQNITITDIGAQIKSGWGGTGTTGGLAGDITIDAPTGTVTNRGFVHAGGGGESTANAGKPGGNVKIRATRLLNLTDLGWIRSGPGGDGSTHGGDAGAVDIIIAGPNSKTEGPIDGHQGGTASNGNGGAGGAIAVTGGDMEVTATGRVRGGRGGYTQAGGRGGHGGHVNMRLNATGNAGLIQGGHGGPGGSITGPANRPGGNGGNVIIDQPARDVRNIGKIRGGDGGTQIGKGGQVTARGGRILRVGDVRGGKNGRGPEMVVDTYANVTIAAETEITFEADAIVVGGDLFVEGAAGATIKFNRDAAGQLARLIADDDITITLPCGMLDVFAWRAGDARIFRCGNDPTEVGRLQAPSPLLINLRTNVFFEDMVQADRVIYAASSCGGSCYADCDQSTGPGVLDIFDFLCFGNRFAMGDPYACDCDVSTGPNRCDIFDFLCFGNHFSQGCP